MWRLAVILLVISVALYLFAPQWVALTADPDFDQGLAVRLLRVFVFGFVALGLSSTTYQILNSFKRFSFAHMGEFTNRRPSPSKTKRGFESGKLVHG